MLKLFSSKKTKPTAGLPAGIPSARVDDSEDPPFVVNNCRCCGTLVKFPNSVTKYRCSICRSSTALAHKKQDETGEIRLADVEHLICIGVEKVGSGVAHHEAFLDLEQYIVQRFGSISSLNRSFVVKTRNSPGSISLVDYTEVDSVFSVVSLLSATTRPFLKLLATVSELLRRPATFLSSPRDVRWLLVLFEIPTLASCLYHNRPTSQTRTPSLFNSPEVKALSYDILGRIIGYIANSHQDTMVEVMAVLSELPLTRFQLKIELLNLYITFHLTRIINKQYNTRPQPDVKRNRTDSPRLSDYSESEKLISLPSARGSMSVPVSTNARLQLSSTIQNGLNNFGDWTRTLTLTEQIPEEVKLKISQYGNEWRIRTAARLISIFYAANHGRVPVYEFYNSFSDYISAKRDFEVWQTTFKNDNSSCHSRRYYDLLNFGCINSGMSTRTPQFTFCQFPFLLTLGCKIAILEYEARRIMEHKAEEAFVRSLDSRKPIDLNLRISVRRTHITNDSLRCIKNHQGDLKKALKVEFIGEPGIDVGGLKKEWFQLLVRDLFCQDNGMFFYNEESHMCWFSPSPVEPNNELFHLVGVILGLAMYNSTILDLKFPSVLYKKLVGRRVRLDDYSELFPSTAKGLMYLLHVSEGIDDMSLYFDTTFKDLFGNTMVKELIPNGTKIPVTRSNRREYVDKWVDFYMNRSVEDQFKSFSTGFHSVIGGNALSLFSPEEIEMVICGNKETRIDTEAMKAVTKYTGWHTSSADPTTIPLVCWFWQWFDQLTYVEQKKFLAFVTGSDRIPAMGINAMSFKLTKMANFNTSWSTGRLPIAHTCFNELCLYEYKTKEDFWKKLDLSISESEGFGLR